MPEIVRGFNQGRMNKDLDERIIPNGEYRDALNLQISTSEGSDVGAFENVKGNVSLNNKKYNPKTLTYSSWDANYISDLTDPVCVGVARDSKNEKIYWLIASDGISVIAEYDQTTDLVSPLVVDTKNILNLSKTQLITGINIIEGILAWTDNNTEPKKIIIKDWVNSTVDFLTHSKIYGRDFIEHDITVVKKYPLVRPSVEMLESDRLKPIETTSTSQFAYLNSEDEYTNVTELTNVTLNSEVDYRVGDTLTFKFNDEDNSYNDIFEIRVTVESILNNKINVSVLNIPDELAASISDILSPTIQDFSLSISYFLKALTNNPFLGFLHIHSSLS